MQDGRRAARDVTRDPEVAEDPAVPPPAAVHLNLRGGFAPRQMQHRINKIGKNLKGLNQERILLSTRQQQRM